jgi:hypothetical protein
MFMLQVNSRLSLISCWLPSKLCKSDVMHITQVLFRKPSESLTQKFCELSLLIHPAFCRYSCSLPLLLCSAPKEIEATNRPSSLLLSQQAMQFDSVESSAVREAFSPSSESSQSSFSPELSTSSQPDIMLSDLAHPAPSSQALARAHGLTPTIGPICKVTLRKTAGTGLGLNIAGGVSTTLGAVFVAKVFPGTVADQCRLISEGDRLLSVQGTSTMHKTQQDVVNILKELVEGDVELELQTIGPQQWAELQAESGIKQLRIKEESELVPPILTAPVPAPAGVSLRRSSTLQESSDRLASSASRANPVSALLRFSDTKERTPVRTQSYHDPSSKVARTPQQKDGSLAAILFAEDARSGTLRNNSLTKPTPLGKPGSSLAFFHRTEIPASMQGTSQHVAMSVWGNARFALSIRAFPYLHLPRSRLILHFLTFNGQNRTLFLALKPRRREYRLRDRTALKAKL